MQISSAKFLLMHSNPVMQSIKMKISNPRFVIPGDSSDIGLEFPHCLKKQKQSEVSLLSGKSMKENSKGLLFAFPQVMWFMATVYYFYYFVCFLHSFLYRDSSTSIDPPFFSRILKFKLVQHSLGLFGFMLQLLEMFLFIYLCIMKWRIPVI